MIIIYFFEYHLYICVLGEIAINIESIGTQISLHSEFKHQGDKFVNVSLILSNRFPLGVIIKSVF